MENRRNFLKQVICASALLASPAILSAATQSKKKKRNKKIKLKKGATVLFQGDSITDAGRGKSTDTPNNAGAFGHGYAFLSACGLLEKYPDKDIKTFNRGISGNKVYQLQERWHQDCFDLNPDVLSILIGVNDFWHKHTGGYDGTLNKYETDYRQLLKATKLKFPNITLIICEPFAINNTSAVNDTWFPEFDKYREVAGKLAEEFDAYFIPFQSIFDKAEKEAPGKYWAPDGVHPSMAGAQLMAEAYLELFD